MSKILNLVLFYLAVPARDVTVTAPKEAILRAQCLLQDNQAKLSHRGYIYTTMAALVGLQHRYA